MAKRLGFGENLKPTSASSPSDKPEPQTTKARNGVSRDMDPTEETAASTQAQPSTEPSEEKQSSLPKSSAIPEDSVANGSSASDLTENVRKPANIGGKRSRHQRKADSKPPSAPPFHFKLVCQRNASSGLWEVLLSFDDQCEISAVSLGKNMLEYSQQQYRIPSLNEELLLSFADGREKTIQLFEEGKPLIFKLKKDWSGKGRKVGRVTSGHFIVIAPRTWKRKGKPRVEEEVCTDNDFLAHYFYQENKISDEDSDGFDEGDIFHTGTFINLEGKQIYDDSDDGTLYVEAVPQLVPSSKIVWARVGEETTNGWGESFMPSEKSLSEVINGRQGHFFLRIFDDTERLLDSIEFRYLCDLQKIEVNGEEYTENSFFLPKEKGYPDTKIDFIAKDDSELVVELSPGSPQSIAPQGKNKIIVPPNPNADCVSCKLRIEGQDAQVFLNLSRVWWKLSDAENKQADWQSAPIIMTREEFITQAHNNRYLSILSKQQASVNAGFEELVLIYTRVHGKDQIEIPLSVLVDFFDSNKRLSEDARFKVQWYQSIIELIRIKADTKQTENTNSAENIAETESIQNTNSQCNMMNLAQTERAFAKVWSSCGICRKGRGFSLAEIQGAEVTRRKNTKLPFIIDLRRRTSHPINIETIKSLTNEKNAKE